MSRKKPNKETLLLLFFDNICSLPSNLHTDVDNGCWIWSGSLDKNGYGYVGDWKTHRLSYHLFISDIPEGLGVLHNCDIPSCVNPSHLRVGTNQDNINDKMERGRWRGPHPGSKHHNAKLTEELVSYIRLSEKSTRVLSCELGVAEASISQARRGIIWKHVITPSRPADKKIQRKYSQSDIDYILTSSKSSNTIAVEFGLNDGSHIRYLRRKYSAN